MCFSLVFSVSERISDVRMAWSKRSFNRVLKRSLKITFNDRLFTFSARELMMTQ